jgi:hypothetical protein
MRRSAMVAIASAVAMVATMMPGVAGAATPQAAWTINVVPYPSTFEAGTAGGSAFQSNGPAYLIQAYNAGAESTGGTFELTDTLPAGLLPVPGFPPEGFYGRQGLSKPGIYTLSCSTHAREVTCTGGVEGPVGPGEGVSVVLPVEVQASAAQKAEAAGGSLSDKASIEGGGASAAATSQLTPVVAQGVSALSPFGFLPRPAGLNGSAVEADGSPATQAGSHPYSTTVAGLNLAMNPSNQGSLLASGGGLRDATVALPKGTVIDPAAVPKCKEAELESKFDGCPDATQVGTVALTLSVTVGFGQGSTIHPIYNMVPPPGSPAELGFEVLEGVYIHLLGSVSSDGTFTLTARSRDTLARAAIGGVRTTLWGVPSEEVHDRQRGECGSSGVGTCPVPRTNRPFVAQPSSCGGPLTTKASLDSWIGETASGEYLSTDLAGNPVGIEGCNALAFEPTIDAKPTTDQGESPSGLEFDLHQTQHELASELSTASLKNTTVTLPKGLVLNPAAAGGLEACSSAQVGYDPAASQAQGAARYKEEPAHCPDASKLGTAEVITPLIEHPLKGSVYLAKPFDNPFGSLLGLYLVIEDEETGIIAKLAGKVTGAPFTGQLTTSFEESPELPLSDVKLDLFDGARAALTTPLTCGTHTTTSTLTPWSTPEGADAHPETSFQTSGGCFGSEGQAPKNVSFTAGTESPLSGSYSPFVLRLSRPDGSQHITGIETALPEGLLGKLAGVSYCPESGIAQAIRREHPEQGKAEIASPSCPSSSEVGTVNVTAGSGISPVAVSGHAYLAGPYKGAPLSLVVIVPAVTGPFDLGTVVDRVALNVGEYDARIHAVADPLPTIREGIPLDVRSIELKLNRSQFTLNPTSCEAKAIEGSVSTQAGQSASLNNRFQVGECGRLAFKPKIAISLKGETKRAGHPALKAVVTYPKEGVYANIARAQVNLPHAEFLDQANLNKVCKQAELKAGSCPKKAIYGKVKAWSPLLEKPLEGNVYLGVGFGYKLPALVAELNGQIRVLLKGKVDTGPNHGIRNTFEAVPDAPVSRFVIELKGGKKYGLFENSENLCAAPQKAIARFTAQNGKVLQTKPFVANQCGKDTKGKGKKKHKKGAKGNARKKGKKSGNKGKKSPGKKSDGKKKH